MLYVIFFSLCSFKELIGQKVWFLILVYFFLKSFSSRYGQRRLSSDFSLSALAYVFGLFILKKLTSFVHLQLRR
jgi:hypothetical protein